MPARARGAISFSPSPNRPRSRSSRTTRGWRRVTAVISAPGACSLSGIATRRTSYPSTVSASSSDSAKRTWSSTMTIRNLLRDVAGLVIGHHLRGEQRDEGRTLPAVVEQLEAAATGGDEPAGDRQAQPLALRARALDLGVEDPVPVLGRDSGALVGADDLDSAGIGIHGERHRATTAVAGRVLQQDVADLGQL